MRGFGAAPNLIVGGEVFNPLQKAGFFFLLLFIYFSFGRLLDFFLGGFRLPLITSLFAFSGMVLSGGIRRVLQSRVSQFLIGFTIWMVVCTPFSVWKGGSVQLLMDNWSRSLLIFITALGLIQSIPEVRKTGHVIGFATITISLLAFAFHITVEEWRWALPIGYLSNPNDLAQLLLAGLPFLGLMIVLPSSPLALKIVGVAGALCAFYVIGATGSRGVLLALFAVGAIFFWQSSVASKVKIILLGAAALMFIALALPDTLVARFKTLSGSTMERATGSLVSAVESSATRLELLKQSLYLTVRNPIVGVGPGQFQTASDRLSKSRGQRSPWRETHNTFTQVSSETGIPGFILYMGVIIACLRGVRKVTRKYRDRPDKAEIHSISYALFLSLISFVVSCLFSSMAYHFHMPVLAAVCAAFLAAEKQLAAREQAASPAAAEQPATASEKQQRPRKPRQSTYY